MNVKRRSKIKMKRVLALILVMMMCLSFVACTETDTPSKEGSNESTSKETSQVKNQEGTFGLNETAVFNDLKFTASALEESNGKNFFEPEDGNVFVGVKFTIENISDEEQTVSSMLLFNGYVDDVKCKYSVSAAMAFEGTLDGSIAPGKKLIGYYSLEVPKDWKKLELDVQSSWLSSTSARFVFEK